VIKVAHVLRRRLGFSARELPLLLARAFGVINPHLAARTISTAFAMEPSASELRRIARRSFRLGLDGGGRRAVAMLTALEDEHALTPFLSLPVLM
jgi:hypothetical protein